MTAGMLRWAGGNLLRFLIACVASWALAAAWHALPALPAQGPFPGLGGFLTALLLSPAPLWLPHLVVIGLLSRWTAGAAFRAIALISALTLGGLWWPVHVAELSSAAGWLTPANLVLPAVYLLYGALVTRLPDEAL